MAQRKDTGDRRAGREEGLFLVLSFGSSWALYYVRVFSFKYVYFQFKNISHMLKTSAATQYYIEGLYYNLFNQS